MGKKICKELGYKFIDTDDYFWMPTDPQYTTKRKKEERHKLMRDGIELAGNIVISGSLVDWGDDLIHLFTIAIRLVTDTDIRILRIKEREKQKLLKCKQIILNGADEIDLNFRLIQEQLQRLSVNGNSSDR